MHPLVAIITAKTEEEKIAAHDALAKANAEKPTDREILLEFLKNCTDLDGASLTLDDQGGIVTLQ